MVRHKNRYIVIAVKQLDKKDNASLLKEASLHKAIIDKVQQFFGDFGVASLRAGFTVKYCNAKTRIAVIRVRHGPHRFVLGSLFCIRSIESERVAFSTLHVGATINQCAKFILMYQQWQFDEFCASLKNDEEKAALEEAIMNFDLLAKIT